MQAFLNRFLRNKKLIVVAIGTLLVMGILYGFFIYQKGNSHLIYYLKNLFYIQDEHYTNQYQLYLILNMIFILMITYLSSSYLGYIGILFFSFIKGVQLSCSLINVFSTVSFSMGTLMIVIVEMVLEIGLIMLLGSMSMYLSIYTMLVTFFIKENFDLKNTLNFRLNIWIVSLIIFSLSLAFRIYVVALL